MAAKAKAKPTMTSCDVLALLRAKYPLPEWVSAAEVRDSTGFGARRSCDFIAMQTFPSKGLNLHGHEIKVSRGDWLREIQDPTKAALFQSRCHFWWIVAPPGVVNLEEMPGSWGLMVATEKTLRVKKAAAIHTPESPDFAFFASMLRAMQSGGQSERALEAIRRESYERGHKEATANAERYAGTDLKVARRELENARGSIAAFEKASGVAIGNWDGGRIGEAVALLRAAFSAPPKRIEEAIRQSELVVKELKAVHEAVAILAPASE